MGQMYGHQGAQSMMGWAPRPQMMMYGECAEGSSGAFSELNERMHPNFVLACL